MVFKICKSGKFVVVYVVGYNVSVVYWIISVVSQIVFDVIGVIGLIGVVIHVEKDVDGLIILIFKNVKNKRFDFIIDEGKVVVQIFFDDIEGVFLSMVVCNCNIIVDLIIFDYG